MLEESQLERLYQYSLSLGMEPLVEVNNISEMSIATRLGACVIGVNNRNLTNFEVDLDTTTRLMNMKTENTIVAALSGISGPDDVEAYTKSGVDAVLVGEALMRADNTALFIEKLLGKPTDIPSQNQHEMLVKICGTRTPEAAQVAIESGADMIGMILVKGRKRCVDPDTAMAISRIVHEKKSLNRQRIEDGTADVKALEYFDHAASHFRNRGRALLVGVFQNQDLDYVLEQQKLLDLDVIQLHGSEPLEWARLIPVPVIRRYGPDDAELTKRGYHALPLLDSAVGGNAEKQDSSLIQHRLGSDNGLRIILAGGLTPENVQESLQNLHDRGSQVVAVDVSSGVEEDGSQSLEKIRDFILAAKAVA